MKNLMLLAVIAISIVSCSPATKIEKSWSEPNATLTPSPDNKALIVAMVKDEASRRVIEDEMVKRFNSNAKASYTLLTASDLKDGSEQNLTQKLTAGGFTHVLLMRLADVEKETSYVPGTTTGYYGGYGRYYRYGAGYYSSPGYYQTDKNYFVESTVYSVNPDKLLWTGTTKTVNPGKLTKTVNEIADVVYAKMVKEGFIK